MPHSNIAPLSREREQSLRKKRTQAEIRMWNLLREFNRQGAKFRRETPIGPYIADFAWLSAKIIVEVDGDTHFTREGVTHDQSRDGFLDGQGYAVLRFSNADLLESTEGAFARLDDICQTSIAKAQGRENPTP